MLIVAALFLAGPSRATAQDACMQVNSTGYIMLQTATQAFRAHGPGLSQESSSVDRVPPQNSLAPSHSMQKTASYVPPLNSLVPSHSMQKTASRREKLMVFSSLDNTIIDKVVPSSQSSIEHLSHAYISMDSERVRIAGGHLEWGGLAIVMLVSTVVMVITFVCEFCLACSYFQNPYVVALFAALNMVSWQTLVHHASIGGGLGLGFGLLFLIRSIVCGVLGIVVAKLGPTRIDLWPQTSDLQTKVCLRGIVGSICVLALFAALSVAPLSLVMVIYLCAPWVASILAWMLLGEQLQLQNVLLMAIGFSAVLLVVFGMHSDGNKVSPGLNLVLGSTLAAVAAISMAIAGVSIKSTKGQLHYITLLVAFSVSSVVLSIPLLFFVPQHFTVLWNLTWQQLGVLVAVSLNGFCNQVMLNKAYSLKEKVAPIMLFMDANMLMLTFFVDTFLGYRYSWLAWSGCLLMLVYIGCSFSLDRYLEKDKELLPTMSRR